ncbi:MAG: SDR family oxidoreductase [Patescibacteria group bacterium]|nr:SDR family oxidoreductase [Patescibacteria group bacterium]
MTKKNISNFNVRGKVIIITGGVGVLGMQYAQTLGRAGATIVLLDNVDKPTFTKRLSNFSGIKITGFCIDISDEPAVQRTIQQVVKKFNRIDVLINNAAMNPAVGSKDSEKQFVAIDNYPVDLWERELKVNLTGMFICIKAVIPFMKKQKSGVIVNIASEVSNIAHDHRVYDKPGKYKSPAYVTSKTGVLGLTRACAAQLGEFNIRVNSFSPGGVGNANLPPEFVKRFGGANMLGRMAESDEYNSAILFLCSDASLFMTGQNLIMDGGKSSW